MTQVAARAVFHRISLRACVPLCLHGSSSATYSSMGAQNGFHEDVPSAPKPLNQLFAKLPDTIFSVMTSLSIKHNSINLGQGFPDDEGPGDHRHDLMHQPIPPPSPAFFLQHACRTAHDSSADDDPQPDSIWICMQTA